MKNLLISALGLLFATGCCAPYFSSAPANEITVQLEGTPGLKVCGSYYIDGWEQTVHGQIPMTIRAVGGDFHCNFFKKGPGDLSLVINQNCRQFGAASAVTPNGGVKARIDDGKAYALTSVTGY